MIRFLAWLGMVTWMVTSPLAAQLSDSLARERARLPDAPSDYLLDQAGLFERDPVRREAMVQRLEDMAARHDLPVYVAIYGTILDSTLQRRSRLLYDRWVGPDRDGIVVVYEADSRQYEIVSPVSQYGQRGLVTGQSRLPEYRMIEIEAAIRVTLEGVGGRLDYIDRLVEILTQSLSDILVRQPSGDSQSGLVRFWAITLLVGLAVAVAGLWANRRLRVAEERARARFYFPEVMVGTRLGAPYCGGRRSVVDFSGEGESAR